MGIRRMWRIGMNWDEQTCVLFLCSQDSRVFGSPFLEGFWRVGLVRRDNVHDDLPLPR